MSLFVLIIDTNIWFNWCRQWHIYQWLEGKTKQVLYVKSLWPCDSIWCHRTWSSLVQVIAYHLFGAKPLPDCKTNYDLFSIGPRINILIPVFMKIVGHFRWLGPNVWWEISQIWIEYIKRIRQMFFGYTVIQENALEKVICKMLTILFRP